MDIQEEKKEWEGGKTDCEDTAEDRLIDPKEDSETALFEGPDDDDDDDDDDDSEDGELVDLPKELRRLKDKTFDYLDELEAELVKRGFPDLPVVIDPKSRTARLRITSGAHDKVTDRYTRLFNKEWGDDVWGVAVDGSTNVFIQALPNHKETRRQPDIAFWGRDKCVHVKGLLEPKDLANPPKIHATREQTERVNPDVVFQFSWGNAKGYEIDAIDDMMNNAVVSYTPLQPNNEAPTLGFLLEVRFKGKKRDRNGRKILRCLDVYRIPHGTTYEDAKANRKGASHSVYAPGGQDVVMEITAQDLRLGNYSGAPGNPYKISAKAIFDSLS